MRLPHRYLPVIWIVFASLVLWDDYLTGPFIQFPVLYLIPVLFAAWYNGLAWALGFAVALPLARLYFNTVWEVPWEMVDAGVNAAIRICVLTLIAALTSRVSRQMKALRREVKVLTGLLPICCCCKKIRDDKDVWQPLESYISRHSEALFSHGYCPECARRHFPELYGTGTDREGRD